MKIIRKKKLYDGKISDFIETVLFPNAIADTSYNIVTYTKYAAVVRTHIK